jgi:hypothetical protein
VRELAADGYAECTRQAVDAWKKRHARDLELYIGAAVDMVRETSLADKVTRVQRYAAMVDRLQNGIDYVETRGVGTGDRYHEIETTRMDGTLVKEWRLNMRAIAEELGQLPQAAPAVVNVDARQQILVRQVVAAEGDSVDLG